MKPLPGLMGDIAWSGGEICQLYVCLGVIAGGITRVML